MTLHDITWHYMTLHYITWHYMTLHDITWHYMTLHDITWHYMTLHDITWHYMTLHDITWHYITLHYIHTYIHTHRQMFVKTRFWDRSKLFHPIPHVFCSKLCFRFLLIYLVCFSFLLRPRIHPSGGGATRLRPPSKRRRWQRRFALRGVMPGGCWSNTGGVTNNEGGCIMIHTHTQTLYIYIYIIYYIYIYFIFRDIDKDIYALPNMIWVWKWWFSQQ